MQSPLSPHIKEARSLQDRGFLDDANRHFGLALSEDPDNVLLVLEAAGNKITQGLIGEVHAMVAAWEAHRDTAKLELDPIHAAQFDTLKAMVMYATTVKFKEPLRCALASYTKYGLGLPVESFGKHEVR